MNVILMGAVVLLSSAATPSMSANQVVQKVLESDPWGLSGAEVSARAVIHDKQGKTNNLAYSARSRRYDGSLAKSLVRFSAPADLAGASFLQIQKKSDDDDRLLFMPELKRSRRIVGNIRSSAFMGTDFSFADLDRRDLRDSDAKLLADEVVDKVPCYHLDSVPKRPDSTYSRVEIWVRKDNFLPVKWDFYDKAKVLQKTLTTEQIKQVGGSWFITRTKMENHAARTWTELFIDRVVPRNDIPEDEFTQRVLEKL